jgi:predicted peroxiredoxin
MGDAVTGISRADSASEKSNGPMLRQHHADCNSSGVEVFSCFPIGRRLRQVCQHG